MDSRQADILNALVEVPKYFAKQSPESLRMGNDLLEKKVLEPLMDLIGPVFQCQSELADKLFRYLYLLGMREYRKATEYVLELEPEIIKVMYRN